MTSLQEKRIPLCWLATAAEIAAALTGHYRAEHLFVLRQALEGYDVYQTRLSRRDDEIQRQICAPEATYQPPDEPPVPLRPARRRSANEPRIEIRAPLDTLCAGVDLTALPGLGPYGAALRLVSSPRSASICVGGPRRSTSRHGARSRPERALPSPGRARQSQGDHGHRS